MNTPYEWASDFRKAWVSGHEPESEFHLIPVWYLTQNHVIPLNSLLWFIISLQRSDTLIWCVRLHASKEHWIELHLATYSTSAMLENPIFHVRTEIGRPDVIRHLLSWQSERLEELPMLTHSVQRIAFAASMKIKGGRIHDDVNCEMNKANHRRTTRSLETATIQITIACITACATT
jgi:hypothetical protein